MTVETYEQMNANLARRRELIDVMWAAIPWHPIRWLRANAECGRLTRDAKPFWKARGY